MSRVLIIDCNNIAYRAYCTTGPLSYKGRPTGVIYGFLNQLLTITKKTVPNEVVFAWDSRKSVRKEHYPFYKENRKKDEGPDQSLLDAFMQFRQLRNEILPELGFANNFIQRGYEADDIIAALVHRNPKMHLAYAVASSDADLLQLLDHCDIYNSNKGKIIRSDDFTKDYGIYPSDWAEVKKIAGCSGDGVPGVQGVGEKTAIKYLTGNLKETSKKYQAIKDAQDIIERNDWLVKLPLPGTEAPRIKKSEFDTIEMRKICNDLGFGRLKNQLDELELLFG